MTHLPNEAELPISLIEPRHLEVYIDRAIDEFLPDVRKRVTINLYELTGGNCIAIEIDGKNIFIIGKVPNGSKWIVLDSQSNKETFFDFYKIFDILVLVLVELFKRELEDWLRQTYDCLS